MNAHTNPPPPVGGVRGGVSRGTLSPVKPVRVAPLPRPLPQGEGE
jgi:hypothetical protein